MPFSLQQKSAYSILYNSTQIARSLGKLRYFKKNPRNLKTFKSDVFNEIEKLTKKIDSNKIKNDDIINSINTIHSRFSKKGVSFGQVQKPINVILKFHFYLCTNKLDTTKKELDCPLDSTILGELGERVTLINMDKSMYLQLQEKILLHKNNKYKTKIDVDEIYDKANLDFIENKK